MKERDPNTAPVRGDRIPYVIIKSVKGAKAFEKAEDPIYVVENNIPIDVQHYLDHQLSQPILRLFEAILVPSPSSPCLLSAQLLLLKL